MHETYLVEVLQTLSCPVQLLSQFSEGGGEKVKARTSSSLLVCVFFMYSMMFPCAIHSETVINRPLPMSP